MIFLVAFAVLFLVFRMRRKARQRRAVAGLAESLQPHLNSTTTIPRGFFKGHGGAM